METKAAFSLTRAAPASLPNPDDGASPRPKRRRRAPSDGSKNYICDHEGCGKAFSRVDHLSRHKLNHNPARIYYCSHCSKQFVRADLLVRHTERHERRVANTTQRRASRVPKVASTDAGTSTKPKEEEGATPEVVNKDGTSPDEADLTATQLPPRSTVSQLFGSTFLDLGNSSTTFSLPEDPHHPPSATSITSHAFQESTVLIPDTGNSYAPNSFDFFPAGQSLSGVEDHAQNSFGMPFSSAFEMDWLFSTTSNFDVTLASSRPVSPGADDEDLDFPGASTDQLTSPVTEHASSESASRQEGVVNDWDALFSTLGYNSNVVTVDTPKNHNLTTEEFLDVMAQANQPAESTQGSLATFDPFQSAEPYNLNSVSSTEPDDVLDSSVTVTVQTRANLIDYLGSEWAELLTDDRMAIAALEEYLFLYWTRVHDTQGPAIHRPSFAPSQTPIPLLLVMILLGSYFAEGDAHELANKIYGPFRAKFLGDIRPTAALWVHQTALLIILFGKLCSTRSAHELGHIFWSSVVTLAKRNGLFSQRVVAIPEEYKNDIEVQWAAWIEEESYKRLGFFGFSIDVEHSALFQHSPCLSTFQIQLCLPCDDEEWEAPTAEEWAVVHARGRQPVPFLSVLKASLTPNGEAPNLNPYSRILVLHGLCSVAQDLLMREQVVGLSQTSQPANWRDQMSTAYNFWKVTLDKTLLTTTFLDSQILRASISLYALAHISLSVNHHELQIYSGGGLPNGSFVSPATFHATSVRLRAWAASKEGRAAAWHAAHFIRSSLQHFFHSRNDLAACLHHRWSVYIAALTVYCYSVSTSGSPSPSVIDHKTATLAFLDVLCTSTPEELSLVNNQVKQNNVVPLCQTIQEYIQTSKWELAQGAAKFLNRVIF